MTNSAGELPISMQFDFSSDPFSNNHLYNQIVHNSLRNLLPSHFLNVSDCDVEDAIEYQKELASLLPLIRATEPTGPDSNISFYVVSKYRKNAFKFLFDMLSCWLVPGRRLNVVLFNAVDFKMPMLGSDVYTLSEVMIRVADQSELQAIEKNFPIIETEIRLGMESGYYARRILEIKGMNADEKTAMIQEYISSLLSRLPEHFDYDVLTETQHVLVMCRDEFKKERESRHLSRIIGVHYLFRKDLRETLKIAPQQRHLRLKLFRAVIDASAGSKQVLGVAVGINFLRNTEIFEESHLLSAIQNYIPSARSVENSFFASRRGQEQICTLYLEIEKSGSEMFSSAEIQMLRERLPTDLKDRIEHLLNPVFMPRNEEEIMRNILTLSNQIKYLHDLPQIIITFDEQTHKDLIFTVILVQIMKPGGPSVQELFKNIDVGAEFIPERSKTLGLLKKKYVKEATVFNLRLSKEQFLRRDHSIDLNKARQTVCQSLTKAFGNFRDFNGGMITKQNELFYTLRNILSNTVKYNELLLENFFYSLTPDVMKTVLDAEVLKKLFLVLLECIDEGFFSIDQCSLKSVQEPGAVFAIVKAGEASIKEEVNQAIIGLNLPLNSFAISHVIVYEVSYFSYLYLSDDPACQKGVIEALELACLSWKKQTKTDSSALGRAVNR